MHPLNFSLILAAEALTSELSVTKTLLPAMTADFVGKAFFGGVFWG